MKKIIFLLLVLLIVTIPIFTGCRSENVLSNDNDKDPESELADISNEQDDQQEEIIITDAEITFVETPMMESSISGQKKTSITYHLTDTISEDDFLFYYFFLRIFTDCDQVGETRSTVTFAGETFDVTYVGSKKLNNIADDMLSIYDRYDIYVDENNVEYHIRADGEIVLMFPKDRSSVSFSEGGEDTVEEAKKFLEKILANRAQNYEYHSSSSDSSSHSVTFQYKTDGYDNMDRIVVLLNKRNEVYAFSSYNLGRFETVNSKISRQTVSAYTSHLKTTLADLEIDNVQLEDSILCEFNGKYYVMNEMKNEPIKVNDIEKFVHPTFFYSKIDLPA